MGKGVVTDTITIIGMIAISALMFSQVPGMVNDIKNTLSQESAKLQATEIANLLTLASISPLDIQITHELPGEVSYTITVKDGLVTIETQGAKASDKTLSALEFGPGTVRSLLITKNKIEKVG